jgi:hypothetical protein
MSSLIFHLTPEQVIVAMDTLAVTFDTRKPFFFCSKAYPLPHLNGIMCCTGYGNMGSDWAFRVGRFVARDIHHLDQYCSEAIAECGKQFPLSPDETTTIYHFGYSEEEQRYVGFAYRSANNFKSERLGYGTGVKPPIAEIKLEAYPGDLIAMMDTQRRDQKVLPERDRLFIGGEVQCYVLASKKITIETVHRFADYEGDYEEMCAGLKRQHL